MGQGTGAALLGLTLLVMLGWGAWSVREYRRTGRAMWLYLALMLGMGMLANLANLGRLVQ